MHLKILGFWNHVNELKFVLFDRLGMEGGVIIGYHGLFALSDDSVWYPAIKFADTILFRTETFELLFSTCIIFTLFYWVNILSFRKTRQIDWWILSMTILSNPLKRNDVKGVTFLWLEAKISQNLTNMFLISWSNLIVSR